MSHSFWKFFSFLSLSCLVGLLGGCATGTTYSDVKQAGQMKPKPGKGLVLVYWRPHGILNSPKFAIVANERLLTKEMKVGTFLSYEAEPGPLQLATGQNPTAADYLVGGLIAHLILKKESVNINVIPNETHYVEMHTNGWHPVLTSRSNVRGERGIQKCRQINSPQP